MTFQVVALNAVMADLLLGETIHHALNIPMYGKDYVNSSGDRSDMATMKYMLQWRWFIKNELLDDIDTELFSFAR